MTTEEERKERERGRKERKGRERGERGERAEGENGRQGEREGETEKREGERERLTHTHTHLGRRRGCWASRCLEKKQLGTGGHVVDDPTQPAHQRGPLRPKREQWGGRGGEGEEQSEGKRGLGKRGRGCVREKRERCIGKQEKEAE